MEAELVLKIGDFPDDLQRVIDAEFNCLSADQVLQSETLRTGVRAILTRSNYTVPQQLLEHLPKLKIIATSGVGYDGIPLAVARQQQVVVTNTPGILDGAVSELAIGLLLALLRRIPAADQFVRYGHWDSTAFALTTGLAGKRVGIVGLGRIGQGIAHRLSAFEVSLGYCGTNPKQVTYDFYDNIRDLAAHSDILVVCCPGGESTRHLVDAEVLSRLGPSGYLINVSRGSVVDQAALIAALKNGSLRGAALDVFETEPVVDPVLRQLPNTVLSPHAGSATQETRYRMLRLALDNIHRVLGGQSALTPVGV